MDVADNKAAANDVETKAIEKAEKESEKMAKKETAAKKKAETAARKLDLGAFLATPQAAELIHATVSLVKDKPEAMTAYMAKYSR